MGNSYFSDVFLVYRGIAKRTLFPVMVTLVQGEELIQAGPAVNVTAFGDARCDHLIWCLHADGAGEALAPFFVLGALCLCLQSMGKDILHLADLLPVNDRTRILHILELFELSAFRPLLAILFLVARLAHSWPHNKPILRLYILLFLELRRYSRASPPLRNVHRDDLYWCLKIQEWISIYRVSDRNGLLVSSPSFFLNNFRLELVNINIKLWLLFVVVVLLFPIALLMVEVTPTRLALPISDVKRGKGAYVRWMFFCSWQLLLPEELLFEDFF